MSGSLWTTTRWNTAESASAAIEQMVIETAVPTSNNAIEQMVLDEEESEDDMKPPFLNVSGADVVGLAAYEKRFRIPAECVL